MNRTRNSFYSFFRSILAVYSFEYLNKMHHKYRYTYNSATFLFRVVFNPTKKKKGKKYGEFSIFSLESSLIYASVSNSRNKKILFNIIVTHRKRETKEVGFEFFQNYEEFSFLVVILQWKKLDVSTGVDESAKTKRRGGENYRPTSPPWCVYLIEKRKLAAPSAQTPTAPKDSNFML